MNGAIDLDSEDSEFVELDPTGRYGRYNEILGKGASKTVYRAFDEYEGIEVAWNQVKLYDFLQSPDDLERLYCEIHLLKTLKHRNIMKFYTSWVDTANRNINFVTEMFTSGTLRQYRMKHKRTNIRAIKHWCRQILQGLVYLHSHDPPVIHRDLKCDNIFINGNQGEVKIGDLGLAAILRKSQASRCVGTPEFMAPEVYEEEYNELVDIYSFGMCILEMVTFEYPYSECTHPAQIYKKVISGKKPDALYKVKDPEVRRFVEKCLATVSDRLSAWELLNDPFLQIDDYGYDLRSLSYLRDYDEIGQVLRQPLLSAHHSTTSSMVNGFSNYICYDNEHDFDSHSVGYEAAEIDLFMSQGDEHLEDVDVSIKGRKSEDDNIFLRLRIADKEGRVRNIYFPFDIETDTALSVATEMVAELDITDQNVTKIAEMIDDEIASLVPEWRKCDALEECTDYQSSSCCQNCDAGDPRTSYTSSHRRSKSVQVQCPKHGCGSVHGRFEEITYQFEGCDQHVDRDPLPGGLSLRDGVPYGNAWAQHEDHNNAFSQAPGDHHFGFENESCHHQSTEEHAQPSDDLSSCLDEDNGNETRQQEETTPESSRWDNLQFTSGIDEIKQRQRGKHFTTFSPLNLNNNGTNPTYTSCNPARLVTAGDGFCSGALLPHPIHQATSLPVNATDF